HAGARRGVVFRRRPLCGRVAFGRRIAVRECFELGGCSSRPLAGVAARTARKGPPEAGDVTGPVRVRRSPRHVSLLAAWMAISCERTTPPNPAGASSAQADPTASAAEPSGDVRRHLFFAAPSRRAPLVMFLHGYGSSPDGAAKAFELARIAR